MESPINQFEVVESIRFFASLVGTEGVSEEAKKVANTYIEALVKCMQSSVQAITAKANGITIPPNIFD